MTPDRPVTGTYGPSKPPRGPSEQSGTRRPPTPMFTEAEQESEEKPPAWAVAFGKSLVTRVEESEGRMMGEFATQAKSMRNDVVKPAEQKIEAAGARAETAKHEAEETVAAAMKIVSRWKGLATALGGLAGLAVATCGGAIVNGMSTNKQVVEVAAEVAESKAAEIESAHQGTRELAEESSRRIDAIESKLDKVLVAVGALVAASEPSPKPAVKKGRAK